MRITKQKILIFLIVGSFAVTFVPWAYGQVLRLNINVSSDSALANGAATVVTPMSGDAYAVQNGRAQKIAGIPLYKIELGNKRYSELVQLIVTVSGLNEENNPSKRNWWVEIGVYYQIPDASTGADYVLKDGTALKQLSNDILYMNRTQGSGILTPQTLIPQDASSATTLYIVATYKNSGGNSAPGQQDQLNNLTFDLMVRM